MKKENKMTILAKFGYRSYEFKTQRDINKAFCIWATPCNQKEFERKLEDDEIDFNKCCEEVLSMKKSDQNNFNN